MYWSELDQVFFVEGLPKGADLMQEIRSTGPGFQTQLKNLNDLKRTMARQVRAAGGNAVVNFKYSQKNSFWTTLFSVDDVVWKGSGTIARINASSLPVST